jgi:peptide/nickel transport system substrate-binding protein
MKRITTTGVALLVVAGLGLAACSGTKTPAAGTPRTLVLESNPVASFTDDFNPFDTKSFSSTENTNSFFYEPLFQFNTLNSTQPPIPWLATAYTWSNGNKTLTFTLRPGVKWSDGQAFSSDDVAFTFGLLKANPAANIGGIPIPQTIAATDPTTVVLTFAGAQSANFQALGNQVIVAKHAWSSIANPATAVVPGATAVGTGPFLLDKFTTQNVTYKANPNFWGGAPKVQKVSVPAYAGNDAATLALASGQIDLAGNNINDVLRTFVARDPAHNHLFQSTPPYFPASNTVVLLLNNKSVNAPALGEIAVRKAISAALDRGALASQCETNYELPASSSGGLTLPIDQSALSPAVTNDLKAGPDLAAVNTLMTAAGWTKVNNKWTKAGKTIKFTIIDPNSFTDYWCAAQAMSTGLTAAGFDVKANGAFDYNSWNGAITTGNFDAALHWGVGNTPFQRLQFNLDSSLTAPIGQVAAADFDRYSSTAASAAIAAFENATDAASQTAALNTLQQIMSSDVPAVPVLYGAAWYEFSTANFTGWPTSENPYVNPSPNSQAYEYLILHLVPVP